MDRTNQPMRLTVFGAAGSVGSRVVKEALARGHEVTAVVRGEHRLPELPAAAAHRLGDAGRVEDVASLSAGQHAVISATRPAPGSERDLVTTAEALLRGVRSTGARLVLVGGAASLIVPGTGGRLVLDDPRYVPPEWRPIAEACGEQLEACMRETDADWTYLSPPAFLEPGARTGAYRVAEDELVVDTEGISRISVEDLAVALLDEVERPRHRRKRFTAAY